MHYGYKKMAFISSTRGHYSLSKAVDLLGLGKQHQQDGNKVLCIVGIAETTETGHIAPLDALAEVAKELGCHFHVEQLGMEQHYCLTNTVDY